MSTRPDEAPGPTLYERYRDALRTGHTALTRRRYVEAVSAYRIAAALAPARPAPWVGIGRVELARRHPDAALTAFRAALALDPRDVPATVGRDAAEAAIETARSRDRGRSARPRHGTAGADAPASAATSVHADSAEVRDLAAAWDRALDEEDAAALLDIALGLARLGRDDAAITAARDALRITPSEPLVYQLLAWIDARRGRPRAAARTASFVRRLDVLEDDVAALEREELRATDEQDIHALLAVADAHRRRGRPRTAIGIAMIALGLAPGDAAIHLAIARARLDLGLRPPVVADMDRLADLLDLDDDTAGRALLAAFVARDLRPRAVRLRHS